MKIYFFPDFLRPGEASQPSDAGKSAEKEQEKMHHPLAPIQLAVFFCAWLSNRMILYKCLHNSALMQILISWEQN